MAYEPINIYSIRIDPRGVAELLKGTGLQCEIEGPPDDWTRIVLSLRKASLFRKAPTMTFGHRSSYYDGDDWPRQVWGMQRYFSEFPECPPKADVLRLVGHFRFALSVPQHDLSIDSDDERLNLIYAVCKHLDGVVFTPSTLRDARGRVLIDRGGHFDPQATFPKMPAGSEADDAEHVEEDDGDEEPIPPSPLRVARRALALTAVAARATLELDGPELRSPEKSRKRLLHWVSSLKIDDEFEPQEWKVLQRPVGKLEQQDFINAMWRVEGLVVLAWALGRYELPPDDTLVIPVKLYEAMGFLDSAAGLQLLNTPGIRPVGELLQMQIHYLMLHWRVRNYRLRPGPMDFVEFSKDCWIGSFDVSSFELIDNDLAIQGVAIDDVDDDQLSTVCSLAMERQLAINWLCGDCETYSGTDTST